MSVDACADLVRRRDPRRFRAALAAPMPARGDLMVLFAFNSEIARAPWVTAEPLIAEMRLQWWHDAVTEIYGGKPRRHEVVDPLVDCVRRHDLPRELLDGLIAARRADIHRERFADWAAYAAYIDASAGHLLMLAAQVLGAAKERWPALRGFASAMGGASFLEALPELAAVGWQPLPEAGGVAHAAELGLAAHALARKDRRKMPGDLRPLFLSGCHARPVLLRAQKSPDQAHNGAARLSEFENHLCRLRCQILGRW